MSEITNQPSGNPIKMDESEKKKLETKHNELNFFILFLSSSEERNVGVASGGMHNDGGAEQKALKALAVGSQSSCQGRKGSSPELCPSDSAIL